MIHEALLSDITEYWDYRDYLRDWYENKKRANSLFSYRAMAMRLEMDTSQLFRILAKEQHYPVRRMPGLMKVLDLKRRQISCFEILVRYNRAKSETEKKSLLDILLSKKGINGQKLRSAQLAMFQKWYISPIRCMVGAGLYHGNDGSLCKLLDPPITEREFQEGIEILLTLGLIEKRPGGRYGISDNHLSTGEVPGSAVIRQYHRITLEQAIRSLDMIAPTERHMSTLTLAVDREAFLEVQEMLRECRRQIQKRIEEAKHPDRVLQVAIALFPVTKQETL